MKKMFIVGATFAAFAVQSASAQMALVTTNYTIRQIRDPVQFQLLINADHQAIVAGVGTSTNNASAITSGNLPLAQMTNALPTAGAYIGGNIAVAALTNAMHGAICIGIPTSTNGLVTGQLWSNSGVLTIKP